MSKTIEKPRFKMGHDQYYQLCEFINARADEMIDMGYDERGEWATQALGFRVTGAKAKEASILTGNLCESGRINTIYYVMTALAHSAGWNIPALAKQGREVIRKARIKAREEDGTIDMFPDAPVAEFEAPPEPTEEPPDEIMDGCPPDDEELPPE